MCVVTLSEIPRLVIEYPIAFTKGNENGPLIPVALFGVSPEQNLYWRDDRWNSVSVPLNIGRQPFFVGVADNPAGGEGAKGLVPCIDLENPGVQESDGEALFDANGAETPYLRHKLASLAELVDGEQKTSAFVEKLVALELIQPIQLELKAPGQQPRKITGLYAIDEKKLRALDGAVAGRAERRWATCTRCTRCCHRSDTCRFSRAARAHASGRGLSPKKKPPSLS